MDAAQIAGRISLRQLRAVIAVAESRSMAKAAEALCVTQPVVSKSIADLEDVLGVRLFDRSPSGVEPTIYGQAFVDRGLAVLNELRSSVSDLRSLAEGAGGELRIGSSEAVAAGMLGEIIRRMSSRYPRLSFEIVLGGGGGDLSQLPYHDLRTRHVDLIICRLPVRIPDDLAATCLYEESSCIAAGAQNELVRRERVELQELAAHAWCGPPFDKFPWRLTADSFRAAGLEIPQPLVRVRSIAARNSLLNTGRFLTVYPQSLIYFAGERLSICRVPVEVPGATYSVGVVSIAGRTANPAAKWFVDVARQVSGEFVTHRVG